MKIIIQGPQACGKGTQARLLAQKYGWMHFEMGKILRSIVHSDNPYASKIKDTLNSGGLVPDELVRLIAWDFVKKNYDKGIVFEGYPGLSLNMSNYRRCSRNLTKESMP